MAQGPGAAPEHWRTLAEADLTADLLPVVSDPAAKISEQSKMQGLGKTPSIFNQVGLAVGIAKWTEEQATLGQVKTWSREPRYGICIQTRRLRAIDIDIPDPEQAQQIEDFFVKALGALPVRYRQGTGKRLLAFWCDGELFKRIHRLAGDAGIIEFLATGQQFVASGLHPSGSRYEWRTSDGEVIEGVPSAFPTVEQSVFDAAWAAVPHVFVVESSASSGERRRGQSFEAFDPVAEYLVDNDLVLDQGHDGQLFVECPWKDGHSMDSGVTEAAWFQAGSWGYERGHFKCLHASCASRSDEDFLDEIGYRAARFEVVEATPIREGEALQPAPLPPFVRDGVGRIEPVLNNLLVALARPDICGYEVGFDEAIHDQVLREAADQPWRPIRDADVVAMRARLESGEKAFKPIRRELMRDALTLICDRRRFDSYLVWLKGLEWDGVPRVARFLETCFGVAPSAYATAVSLYWWSAAAGRLLKPGIQADMVPVLVGDQGLGKSQALKALMPFDGGYVEIHLGDKEDNLARLLRGALIGELAELRGLRTREAEAIKAWITRQQENWTPKFKERNTVFKRRCIFVGTTNEEQFLDDPTGERRWLPVVVGAVDVARVRAERDQLWAEARVLFEAQGVIWREAQTLARAEHEKFKVVDERRERVVSWLYRLNSFDDRRPADREYLVLVDVAQEALGIDPSRFNRSEQMAVSKILAAEGYKVRVRRLNGRLARVWERALTTYYDLV